MGAAPPGESRYTMTLSRTSPRLRDRLLRRCAEPERGDVPGWVLITIMTAGLITVIYGVASEQLQDILTNALNSVRSP
jgi:hypothetical protein